MNKKQSLLEFIKETVCEAAGEAWRYTKEEIPVMDEAIKKIASIFGGDEEKAKNLCNAWKFGTKYLDQDIYDYNNTQSKIEKEDILTKWYDEKTIVMGPYSYLTVNLSDYDTDFEELAERKNWKKLVRKGKR